MVAAVAYQQGLQANWMMMTRTRALEGSGQELECFWQQLETVKPSRVEQVSAMILCKFKNSIVYGFITRKIYKKCSLKKIDNSKNGHIHRWINTCKSRCAAAILSFMAKRVIKMVQKFVSVTKKILESLESEILGLTGLESKKCDQNIAGDFACGVYGFWGSRRIKKLSKVFFSLSCV